MTTQEHDIDGDRRLLFAAAAVALGAMLVVPPLFRFRVDLLSFYPVAVLAGVPALFLPYICWRGLGALRPALETTALGVLLTAPTLVFTYAAMRAGAPLADARLAAWDAAVGFDWLACVRLIDRSPALADVLRLAYNSFVFQLLCLPALLCVFGRPGRAYRLVAACVLLSMVSSVVGAGFPAQAAYVQYGLDAASLGHVDGHFGRFFLESFEAARRAEPFTLRLGDVAGILTFPSGHAAAALLCAWAAWPSRTLRAVFAPLNLLMLASAVPNGGHYLVDLVAGIAAALLVVGATGRLRLVRPFGGGVAPIGPVRLAGAVRPSPETLTA